MRPERAGSGPIAIVGTVVEDRILRPDGAEAHGLGGLVYGVAALARSVGDRRRIRPVCRTDALLRSRLERAWSGLPGIDLGGLVAGAVGRTRVELDYRADGLAEGDRLERLMEPVAPLTAPELIVATRGAALVVVNMITGFDVELDAYRSLPADVWVLLDVHSLALARGPDGLRSARAVPEAAAWLAGADAVQCNRREAAMLTGTDEDEAADRLAGRLASMLAAARRPRFAILTLGVEGAILVGADGEAVRRPVPRRAQGDPTGAGDTLGAAFAAAHADGEPALAALDRAMAAAADACERSGADTA